MEKQDSLKILYFYEYFENNFQIHLGWVEALSTDMSIQWGGEGL